MNPVRHPNHDELTAELRSWFTNSAPEIEYYVTRHWFGYLSSGHGPAGPRLILDIDEPRDIVGALGDAKAISSQRDITVWVDDRERQRALDDGLRQAGCTPVKATTHLALVGDLTSHEAPNLDYELIGTDTLEDWARTKIRAFDNTETEPSETRLAAELAVRGPELVLASLTLARLEGEPIGVSAFYKGADQLLFNLGTRVPFRHRGIAQAMLGHWVRQGQAARCRSLIINADDPGAPQMLYRHMGFVDEIYWYQSYTVANSKASDKLLTASDT